jgi:hypothetical protein
MTNTDNFTPQPTPLWAVVAGNVEDNDETLAFVTPVIGWVMICRQFYPVVPIGGHGRARCLTGEKFSGDFFDTRQGAEEYSDIAAAVHDEAKRMERGGDLCAKHGG